MPPRIDRDHAIVLRKDRRDGVEPATVIEKTVSAQDGWRLLVAPFIRSKTCAGRFESTGAIGRNGARTFGFRGFHGEGAV